MCSVPLRPLINVLRLDLLPAAQHVPIFQQLVTEEALFRNDGHNWCILNRGSVAVGPQVVMGISGKPEKLLDVAAVARDGVPVIKRFTGGGTVVVDEGTLFATLICNTEAVPGTPSFPQPIMDWSRAFYGPVFQRVCGRDFGFELRENDYVSARGGGASRLKFGGNAQSISRNRFVHHTSFLWDWDDSCMEYLQLPEKRPEYRADRPHCDFLLRLRDAVRPAAERASNGEVLLRQIERELSNWFEVRTATLAETTAALAGDHRKGTRMVEV